MSQVEFDEDSFGRQASPLAETRAQTGAAPQREGGRGLSGWLIRHHVVKDEKGARAVLVSITIVDFALMALVLGSLLFR